MSKICIVIGDSILGGDVPQGIASDMALSIITHDRDVSFKNLSSPGAALGVTDSTGFNNTEVITTIRRLGGFFARWDSIMVMAGVNDYNRSVKWQDMVDSLRRIITYAATFTPARKVIVFDPIWKAGEDANNSLGYSLNTYRYFLYLVTLEFGNASFAHRENTIMGTSAGAAFYDSAEVAAGTQMHPNVAGHHNLADWIKYEANAAGLF